MNRPTKFTDFNEMQVKYKKMETQLEILCKCTCKKRNLGKAYNLCDGCLNAVRIKYETPS